MDKPTICAECAHATWPYWRNGCVYRCKHPEERIGFVGVSTDFPLCHAVNTDGKCPRFTARPKPEPLKPGGVLYVVAPRPLWRRILGL
jgi:hypothetical protein